MAVKKNTEVENVEVTETVEKEAVNVLDLLLGSDLGTIKQPHKDMEISRTGGAKVGGDPYYLSEDTVLENGDIIIELDIVAGDIIAGKDFLLYVHETFPFSHGGVHF